MRGLLVYVKPSIDGDEPVELLQYRNRNKSFPHEPTSDQLFDPSQVESYRQLGYHIGMQLLRGLPQEFCDQSLSAPETTAADLAQALERMHVSRSSPSMSSESMSTHSFAEPSVAVTAGSTEEAAVTFTPPNRPR